MMMERIALDKQFTFMTWVKIIIITFLLFIGLNYLINQENISLLFILIFSFLSSWITWRDLKGYVIKDNILIIVFAGLSYSLNSKSIFEYFTTVFLLAFSVMIVDYLSTGYTFSKIDDNAERTGNNMKKLYFGSAGYLIGWTQSTVILLITYMLFPIENNLICKYVVNGWEMFINSIFFPIITIIILMTIVLLQHNRKKEFEKNHTNIIYYKNIRAHTVWFIAFFGALLSFPLTLAIMIFSFILYIPLYLYHFFHLKISDIWVKENIIKFFSYGKKKI